MSIETAKKVLKIEAKAIMNLLKNIDENFTKAVDLILSSKKGRVVVTGMGKSGIIGKKISATLSSTGTPSFFLHPSEGIHGDLGMVLKDDIILVISNSGETEEINRLLPFFKRMGNKIIAFSGVKNSTLTKNSNIVINIGVKEEACPLGLAPTASTTATLAMGDALSVSLLTKRGFKKKDFARLHPGGTLGRRLMLKVEDIMRRGEEIPSVNEEVTMMEAIREMTDKNFGFTTVLDGNGRLKGIITDGDLRRAIQRDVDFQAEKVGKVMAKNPKTIEKEKLVVEAVEKMEKNSITSLIIVNQKKKPVGIVHLHDLLGREEFKFEVR